MDVDDRLRWMAAPIWLAIVTAVVIRPAPGQQFSPPPTRMAPSGPAPGAAPYSPPAAPYAPPATQQPYQGPGYDPYANPYANPGSFGAPGGFPSPYSGGASPFGAESPLLGGASAPVGLAGYQPITSAPYMTGDFFRPGGIPITLVDVTSGTEVRTPIVTVPMPGGNVGRVKIAEISSPMPRDRFFTNFSYFRNARLTDEDVNVSRFSPGFEKTFFCGRASFEARFPFASTLNSMIDISSPDTRNFEFGNIYLGLKLAAVVRPTWVASVGVGVSLPTGDDVIAKSGGSSIRLENKSVHVLPFAAVLYTPTPRLFAQAFVQVDIDANGNPVTFSPSGLGTMDLGILNDPTFLYADVAAGFWIYRNPHSAGWLTGIAPLAEFHYNRSLQTADFLPPASPIGLEVGVPDDQIEVMNVLGGAAFEFGLCSLLTVGYAFPVGGERQFDGELRVVFSRRF